MDKEEIIEKLREYKKLIQKHFDLDRVILFGSYSRDEQTEDSDIDVAVVVNSASEDYFSTVPLLWKLRRMIDYRIEPVLLEKDNDESGFLQDIIRTGIVID